MKNERISGEFLDNFLKKDNNSKRISEREMRLSWEEQTILTQSDLRWNTIFIKSLILAQDERWRRA